MMIVIWLMVGIAGLLMVRAGAQQWRHRVMLTAQSNDRLSSSDKERRVVNRVRVRAGAVILGGLGVAVAFSGLANAVSTLV